MTSDQRLVVWIVDDAEPVRKSIGAVLETADIAVRDYGSADDFLADFAPVEPGCIVVDHHMPGLTGLELLRHLRDQGVNIPVIVITGKSDAVMKAKALAAGAVTLLDKPLNGNDLIALIKRVVPNSQ